MNQAVKSTTLKCTALAAIILGGAFGCEPPVKTKPLPPAPTFTLPPTRAAAVAELMPLVSKFNDDISGFPGVTGSDHRKTLVLALDDLNKILRLISGPTDQMPDLASDLAIITAAKETASVQSLPRERMVAIENEALQAADSALKELSTRYLLDKDQLPGLVDTLNAKVVNAAGVTGTMHDLDATDCFQAVAAVVGQMANDLKAMVPGAGTPEVQPTPVTPPAGQPATVPAPTTLPAPMPTPTPAP